MSIRVSVQPRSADFGVLLLHATSKMREKGTIPPAETLLSVKQAASPRSCMAPRSPASSEDWLGVQAACSAEMRGLQKESACCCKQTQYCFTPVLLSSPFIIFKHRKSCWYLNKHNFATKKAYFHIHPTPQKFISQVFLVTSIFSDIPQYIYFLT